MGNSQVVVMTKEELMKFAKEAGEEAARNILKDQEKRRIKRHDRRLRNTALLLKNYKNFVAHCNNAVFTSKQLKIYNAIDILDECDDLEDDEVYVKSIMKTKERTTIILNHINKILGYYKYTAKKEPEKERIYKVIKGIYVDKKTYQGLSEELNCSTKTIERDRKEGVSDLSILIFGIDGVRLET